MSGHADDDVGAASKIDAYEESYFTSTLDMSKYSHLHPEELR